MPKYINSILKILHRFWLANYDDNQLYCGGIHQADDPGSNCGVCGDPISQSAPRDNEIGGKYDKGIIAARYSAGQVIDIQVELTAAHLGNMEWRLCTNPSSENQACFNQHVLQLADGSGTKYAVPPAGTGMHSTRVKLPAGVTCQRCIIQWNYRCVNLKCLFQKRVLLFILIFLFCLLSRAGNGWPADGPQETFRGCADVTIS